MKKAEPIIYYIDFVVVMSVNPGFGGQSFIPGSTNKIQNLSRLISDRGLPVEIQVDGGINKDLAAGLASADMLVAGSSVFGADDTLEAMREIREAVKVSDQALDGI